MRKVTARTIGVAIIISLCFFVLSGCSLFDSEPEVKVRTVYKEKPIIHEPLPDPDKFNYTEPHIITKETIEKDPDDIVYQCFEYDDGQQLGIELSQFVEYTEKLKALVCSYRRDLNEEECKPYFKQENSYEVQDKD